MREGWVRAGARGWVVHLITFAGVGADLEVRQVVTLCGAVPSRGCP